MGMKQAYKREAKTSHSMILLDGQHLNHKTIVSFTYSFFLSFFDKYHLPIQWAGQSAI